MLFEWDQSKSQANLIERGFDFAVASAIFGGPTVETEDGRRDYSERRVIAIGMIGGLCFTVVYTDRHTDDSADILRRIISARRSNRRERKTYEAAFKYRSG